ncbi:unnamed protein product [Closterium sp. Yama58-4]|nr:unnamed protein product [Closterium sp. Yama58-4]
MVFSQAPRSLSLPNHIQNIRVLFFVSRAKINIPTVTPLTCNPRVPVCACGAGGCAQRVKVYRLNDDGKWDDKGTGHVSVEYLERSDAIGLVVIDEEDNATLLVHRISTDDIYQRQEDTIISWTDPEVATDLALSFQESMGCAYIWDQICNVQRQIQLPSILATEVAKESSELPAVEARTLPAIAKLVTDVSPFHRDRMASLILREGYVQRLVALFRASEGAHDTPALHHLYRIFKGLVLLNDSQLLEQLFAPDAIMDVIGALECESPCPHVMSQLPTWPRTMPHAPPTASHMPHLPRAPHTFSSINSLILFNNVEVVTTLHGNKPFLADLFARLRATDPHSPQFTDLVRFLQEFCSLHKHLQLAQRTSFFSALIAQGLFDVCTLVMQHPLHSVRLSGIDILMSLMVPDPAPLRTFLVEQPNHALLSCLVRGMVACRQAEEGLHAQLLEMLRVLLDPDTMDAADKSKFLDLFYEDYLQLLISAVVAGANTSQPSTCPPAARDLTGLTKKRRAAQGRADGVGSRRAGGEAGRGAGGKVGASEAAERGGAEGREAERGGARGTGELGGAEGEERRGGEEGGGGGIQEPPSPDVLTSICDLLCFCVQHHSFRMKYYVLRNSVAEKVLRLTQRREKYLSVAAIRFLRCCVALKDDFYVRYLVKNRLLDPVMAAFRANGARYNLLNSAVLELIDFVRKENVRPLVAYIVESYGSWLDCIDYVDSFKLLRLKYEQNLEKRPRGCVDSSAAQADSRADGMGESGREQGGEGGGVPEGTSTDRAAEGGEPGASGRKRRSIEGRGGSEGDKAGVGKRQGRRQLSVEVGEGDGEGVGEEQVDHGGDSPKGGGPKGSKGGSPKGGSPKGGSPKGGSPKGGSPKGGSPKGGSPKGGSPKGGSPKGASPKSGSPKGDQRMGGVRSVGDAGKKALSMRKRFLQVRTQDNATEAPLGEVVPGGGAAKGRGGALGREEPTLGVCSPRPVLCDPWRSARGKGRERAGSAEGDEGDGGDGGDDGEWAVRLAMAEEEEERRQADVGGGAEGVDAGDGGDGDDNKGGGNDGTRGGECVEGECAGSEAAGRCGVSDACGKGGSRDADEGKEGMLDDAGMGEQEQEAHGEEAGSGVMSRADESDAAEARTAAPGGAQNAARSVVEALR